MNLYLKITSIIKQYQFILLFLVIAVIGYWQMFFFELKWDNIDQFFPFRYFFDSAFQLGQFPLWNPYINLGYPVYADPQGAVWYPFTWIVSVVFGYNFYSFNIEVWAHYFFAAVGCYRLGQSLQLDNRVSFGMGIIYMFSGFFVGTSQIFPFIIGATWLPFTLSSLVKLSKKITVNEMIRSGLYVSLAILGAYPAYMIILFYMYLSFFIFYLGKNRLSIAALKRTILGAGVLLLTVLVLAGGYLYSLIEVYPDISRSAVLPYDEFFYGNSFTFQACISFLYPYATAVRTDFFHSNISMINGYIGVLTIPFILLYFRQSKGKNKWVLLALIVVLFLASTGNQTPVRYWMYTFIPGFELFRHPSVFRIYFMLGLIVLFGKGLHTYITRPIPIYLQRYTVGVLVVVLIGGLISFWQGGLQEIIDFISYAFKEIEKPTFSIFGPILGQSFILAVLLLLWLIVQRYIKNINSLLSLFLFLLIFDVTIAAQLNMSKTVTHDFKLADCQAQLDKLPKTFANQSVDDIIGDNHEKKKLLPVPGLKRNQSFFSKKIAYDGYNPFELRMMDSLRMSGYWEKTVNNPLVFLTHQIGDINAPDTGNNNVLHVSSSTYMALAKKSFSHSTYDNVSFNIAPNEFRIQYNSKDNQLLALLQNNHPNWIVTIDNKEVEVLTYNHSLMAVEIPAGSHEVIFSYKSYATILFFLSVLSFLLVPLWLWIKKYF